MLNQPIYHPAIRSETRINAAIKEVYLYGFGRNQVKPLEAKLAREDGEQDRDSQHFGACKSSRHSICRKGSFKQLLTFTSPVIGV